MPHSSLSESHSDLSHYDLIDIFTARDAACLIAGIDPNMQDVTELYGSPAFARMRAIEEAIEQAWTLAMDALEEMAICYSVAIDGEEPYDPWLPNAGKTDMPRAMLPSVELLARYRLFKSIRKDSHVVGVRLNFSKEKFRREHLTQWVQARRYSQARYFRSTPDIASTSHDTALSRIGLHQLQAENDRLKSELAKIKADLPVQPQSLPGNLSFMYETAPLRLVSAVQQEFLCLGKDYKDSDMQPAKDDIVQWIMEQDSKLTKVTAEAIERVAMPFSRGR
ncbi:hypothetical protein [Kerstersia similis]|uniref:hypothetical protein n=1 Tax=Kerstersia similis TaxID=206505 RepID=UPI0039F05EE7